MVLGRRLTLNPVAIFVGLRLLVVDLGRGRRVHRGAAAGHVQDLLRPHRVARADRGVPREMSRSRPVDRLTRTNARGSAACRPGGLRPGPPAPGSRRRRRGRAPAAVLWASRGRAVALGNHVFLPDRCAADLATLAHELHPLRPVPGVGRAGATSPAAPSAQLRELLHRALRRGRESLRTTGSKTGSRSRPTGWNSRGRSSRTPSAVTAAALAVSPFRPPADLGLMTAIRPSLAQDAPSA